MAPTAVLAPRRILRRANVAVAISGYTMVAKIPTSDDSSPLLSFVQVIDINKDSTPPAGIGR